MIYFLLSLEYLLNFQISHFYENSLIKLNDNANYDSNLIKIY